MGRKRNKIGYNWNINLLNSKTKIMAGKREKILGLSIRALGKSHAIWESHPNTFQIS